MPKESRVEVGQSMKYDISGKVEAEELPSGMGRMNIKGDYSLTVTDGVSMDEVLKDRPVIPFGADGFELSSVGYIYMDTEFRLRYLNVTKNVLGQKIGDEGTNDFERDVRSGRITVRGKLGSGEGTYLPISSTSWSMAGSWPRTSVLDGPRNISSKVGWKQLTRWSERRS